MEGRTELIFDRSLPPMAPMHFHVKRDEADNATSTITSSTRTSTSTTDSIATASSTSTSFPLPQPFDSSLGNNFTASSCPIFFESFLSDDTFQSCHPLSLLLQTSNGFFAASKSFYRLTETLTASCTANFTLCSNLMADLASDIQSMSNCGADLQLENPMVVQAYNGFVAYQPLYQAGCLATKADDSHDGSFCFAEAVTNSSSPTNSYIYYLPLGVALPGGTTPTCNTCLQETMAVFASAANNNSVPLSDDYAAAASQVDVQCGPRFVSASTKSTSTSAAVKTAGLFSSSTLWLVPLLAVVHFFATS